MCVGNRAISGCVMHFCLFVHSTSMLEVVEAFIWLCVCCTILHLQVLFHESNLPYCNCTSTKCPSTDRTMECSHEKLTTTKCST